jgi:DNA-binding SARP family transcriptional activator/Tfp pilus assembly protein PilF
VAAEAEFCLLGPLVVRRGGVVVPVTAGKQRVVLAALLLSANRVVSLEELNAALWGLAPPASARVTLQNYVKRLRQGLGGAAGSRISTLPQGYMITVAADELDVSRFEGLVGRARKAAGEGAWDRAAAQLRRALSLWRGEPLAGVPSKLLAEREAPRLAEMRLQAIEARIDADLHLGRHGEVIGELRQLAGVHPLRERLHALLMLALYRDGQQAEALAAFQRARRVLIEELGSEPWPELRALQRQILTADPVLRLPALGPGGPAGEPRQLPAAVAHFAGRTDELKALTGVLDAAAAGGTAVISAIGGTAGVGKTALAVHWAHQVAGRFPGGQLYVNLRGFDPSAAPLTPADAVRRFLDALGVPAAQIPAGPEAQQGLYRSLLAGRRMLIVLDNARDAAQVRPLLPGDPGCLVLATSRSQLASLVAAEGAHPLTLDVLSPAEARSLLERRLGPERVATQPQAAAELARLCAYLPLALAIAAARAALNPAQPLGSLAAQLRDAASRLDALDTGDAAASVRAVFSWSYRQLPEPAARMFRLLSIHPGPDITAPAAASLAAIPTGQARHALTQLTRASLLTEHAPGRYAFHDLLRAYATEQATTHDSQPDRHAATHRTLDHYLHTASAADLALYPIRRAFTVTPPQPGVLPEEIADYQQAMAWFEAEHRVLLAAIAQAASTGFDTHAWQLPLTLTIFLERQGHWDDYAPTQQTALAAAQRLGDRTAQAFVRRSLARASMMLGSYPDARAHYEQALELSRQLGDRAGQGRAHFGLSQVCEKLGRYDQALAHNMQALDLHRATGDRTLQATALNNIGWCHAQLGDYQQALPYCEQALALHQELGEHNGEAHTWDSIGYARHHLSQYPQAIACYQQALALFRDQGDRFSQAEVLIHLGDSHDADGQPRAAREAWEQALAVLGDLDHPRADEIRARLQPDAAADSARGPGPAGQESVPITGGEVPGGQ